MNKQILNQTQLDDLLELLKWYKKDELIYPGVVIRQLSVDSNVAYKVLEELRKIGIVEINYELYCHDCNKFYSEVYRRINEIPLEFSCENCGSILPSMEHAIIIYRVINDGDE